MDNQLYKVKFDCLKVTCNSTTIATTNKIIVLLLIIIWRRNTKNFDEENSLKIYNYMH